MSKLSPNRKLLSLFGYIAPAEHRLSIGANLTPVFLQYLFYSIHAYNLGLTFTKSAILLLYLRIFSFRTTRVLCYIVMAVVIMYGIQAILTGIFTCIPVQAFWDKSIPVWPDTPISVQKPAIADKPG